MASVARTGSIRCVPYVPSWKALALAYLAPNLFDELLDRLRHIDNQSVHVQPQDPVVVRQPLADEVGLVEVNVCVAPVPVPIRIETHPFHVISGSQKISV